MRDERHGRCVDCHASRDQPTPEMPGVWPFHVGWLPTLTNAKISQCYDEIAAANEDGVRLYKSLAPQACLP